MNIAGEEVFFPETRQGKETIVYVPLRGYLFQSVPELRSELADPASPVRKSFLEEMRKRPYLDPKKNLDDLHRSVPGLSIPITDDCNLRCKYCYFCAGDAGRAKTMDAGQIKKCVDAYFSQLDRYSIWESGGRLGVSIAGGGEPTYKFAEMRYAIDYISEKCEERGLRPRFSMPTNGVYGDLVREYIVKHFSHVSLSMDGMRDIQDRQRPLKNGGSSFDAVYRTGKYFLDAGMSFTIRSTISQYSLSRIEEILDFFHKEFPGIKVGLEPLDDLGRASSSLEEQMSPSKEEFSTRLNDAYGYAAKLGMTIRNSSVGHFELLTPFFCRNACAPGWVFTTDGRIVACSRVPDDDSFCFGFYDERVGDYVIDRSKVASLQSQNVLNFEECADCFMKYNCGGDCPHKRLLGMRNCDSTRAVGLSVLRRKLGLEE